MGRRKNYARKEPPTEEEIAEQQARKREEARSRRSKSKSAPADTKHAPKHRLSSLEDEIPSAKRQEVDAFDPLAEEDMVDFDSLSIAQRLGGDNCVIQTNKGQCEIRKQRNHGE